ncbi:MAG TPA: ABC transporter ATP-binding protein, partial [Myxococcales bacterium]
MKTPPAHERASATRGAMGHGPMGHGRAMPFEKAKDFKGALRRLLGYLRPLRGTLAAVATMTLLSTLFGVLGPKLMGHATTGIFEGMKARLAGAPGGGVDFAALAHTLLALVGLYLFSAAFTYLQQYVMAGLAQRVVLDLRRDVSAKLARLPLKFFDGHSHGDVLSRVSNDVDNIGNTLQQSLAQVLGSALSIVGTLVMMLTISPLLTLIGLLILPVVALLTRVIMGRSKGFFTAQQKAIGDLSGHVDEMYAGQRIVKAFGREQAAIRTFEEINERLFDAGWKAQFVSGLLMPLIGVIGNLGYVAVCVVGGVMAAHNTLAVGDIQAFIQYLRHFSMPIMQTATIANVIQSTMASAERVFELLDEPEERPDAETARKLDVPRGEIGMSHVRFSYEPGTPLIEDLSLQVRPGQTVAIVGPTGAGKTTLVNLLMRFYELDGGAITLDGVDLRELRRGPLRSHFGMVLQDTWLFQGTLRENIAFGREGATEEEIVAAAKAAHADHFIRTLPEGYDTRLNEDATNLSQGQRQLLTIARAILANPAVLVFDEATSSVDTRTELHVQRAMQQLMRGRTAFVVAHRLSTVRDADLILVMNEGRIVEQGRHDELLQRKGFYAELYES